MSRYLTLKSFAVRGPNGYGGGPPGKSAYEAAVDGGYTGTETQFNALLATLGNTTGTDAGKVFTVDNNGVAYWTALPVYDGAFEVDEEEGDESE